MSTRCMTRPPSRFPNGFACEGSAISDSSEALSRTRRPSTGGASFIARILAWCLMSQDRLQALYALLEQDPANTFARYGLAQALANAGRFEEAVAAYQELMSRTPDYVAAYYHSGQTLEKMGKTDE